jgi:hypothetical protein
VPLATALSKTFLLRILNDSWAGRNPARVVVSIEEEEEESLTLTRFGVCLRRLQGIIDSFSQHIRMT